MEKLSVRKKLRSRWPYYNSRDSRYEEFVKPSEAIGEAPVIGDAEAPAGAELGREPGGRCRNR
jgi:hypothetical protein